MYVPMHAVCVCVLQCVQWQSRTRPAYAKPEPYCLVLVHPSRLRLTVDVKEDTTYAM